MEAAVSVARREGWLRMVSATEIVALQDQLTKTWHAAPDARVDGSLSHPAAPAGNDKDAGDNWLNLVARQHRANFDLWHIEDEARAPGASDAEIAGVKRRIDRTNQLRNDLIEELDRMLQGWMESRSLLNSAAPLNSEPPGMIIDRLSILALKIYHTREEAERPAAPPGHAARNLERLRTLEEQRADLAGCLDALWQETLRGTRRFKFYQQLKMYNDPTLNPAIYGKAASARGR